MRVLASKMQVVQNLFDVARKREKAQAKSNRQEQQQKNAIETERKEINNKNSFIVPGRKKRQQQQHGLSKKKNQTGFDFEDDGVLGRDVSFWACARIDGVVIWVLPVDFNSSSLDCVCLMFLTRTVFGFWRMGELSSIVFLSSKKKKPFGLMMVGAR